MATLEQIEAALRAADAAGNTEDARALAQAYAQAKAAQPQAPKPPQSASNEIAAMIAGKPKPRRRSTYNLTGVPGVSTQVGAFLDGLQHHTMNPLHGAAQLVTHGLEGVGILPDGTAAADDAALRRREADYQARTGDTALSYAGAAVGEVAPWMLAMRGLRSAGLLPKLSALKDVQGAGAKAANIAARTGLLAAEGATMGAVTPVTGEGDFASQKGAQVTTGAIAAPAVAGGAKLAGAAARGARQGARFLTERGREQVADQRVAKLFGSDAAVLQALRSGSPVPGFQLTPAQALMTPEAVQTERMLRNNALTAPAFAAQESANNVALRDVVAGIAGTDADAAAARAARKAATDPYYSQLPGQMVDPAPVLAALDSLTNSSLGVRPNIKSAAASLKSEIQARLQGGKIDAGILSGLHENAGSHLGPMASAQEKKALGPIKDSIADALDAAVPGYRANLAAYGRASQPLSDMAAGRAGLDAIDRGGRDAGGNQIVDLAKIKSILAKDDKARFKMSPQARTALEQVLEAAQRRSVANNTIAAAGPGSAADTLRGLSSSPVGQRSASGLAGLLGASFGGLDGGLASLLLLEGANAANNSVTRKVGQKAASAKRAADAIEAHLARQKPGLLEQYMMPSYLLPYIER